MASRIRRTKSHHTDQGVFGLPGDVAPWDIRFDAGDVAHLEHLSDGSFRLRVWTQPELVDGSVVVRISDGVTEFPMESVATGRQTIHEVIVGPYADGAEFSLAFRTADARPVYFTPGGVAVAIERIDRWEMNPSVPTVDVPDWAVGAVMYQIFPERFANGDRGNDPVGTVPWGSEPEPTQFQGGDLAGVADRLEYLEWLGVDVLYLNPIFTSPSNHKYDTVDYRTVDPAFGGDAALLDLVSQAHSRDIRVILDASFNHVHPRFFAFQDLVKNGGNSEFADWFVVSKYPLRVGVRRHQLGPRHWMQRWLSRWESEVGLPLEDVSGPGPTIEPSYEAWYNVPSMPRLNLASQGARAYVLGIADYWLREFDVDGWRMDVARYVDPDFWPDFRAAAKAAKPDAYLISEVMGDASDWLQGDSFDGTMNYTFRSLCLRFLADEAIDGPGFLDEAARTIHQYSWPATLTSQNLIGSHDTPRFLTEAGGESWRLVLATVLQMTIPGMPGIYYGDEMGLDGGEDPGCRKAFPWNLDPADSLVATTIAALSTLRRSRSELVDGLWRPVSASRHLAVFERVGNRRTLVAINRGRRTATFEAPRTMRKILWGTAAVTGRSVAIPAHSAALLTDR